VEVAGVLDPANPDLSPTKRGIVCVAIEQALTGWVWTALRALLGAGRKDDSGDFTRWGGPDRTQAMLHAFNAGPKARHRCRNRSRGLRELVRGFLPQGARRETKLETDRRSDGGRVGYGSDA